MVYTARVDTHPHMLPRVQTAFIHRKMRMLNMPW
jgi:hypothetical protein